MPRSKVRILLLDDSRREEALLQSELGHLLNNIGTNDRPVRQQQRWLVSELGRTILCRGALLLGGRLRDSSVHVECGGQDAKEGVDDTTRDAADEGGSPKIDVECLRCLVYQYHKQFA